MQPYQLGNPKAIDQTSRRGWVFWAHQAEKYLPYSWLAGRNTDDGDVLFAQLTVEIPASGSSHQKNYKKVVKFFRRRSIPPSENG